MYKYLFFYLLKQKENFLSMIIVEMIIVLVINLWIPFTDGGKMKIVTGYKSINQYLEKVDIEEDSLERTYFTTLFQYNSNRFTKKLTNEITFHSFVTKYIYDYSDLYSSDKHISLILDDLNNFSPNFSRIMNYKYVVVEKGEKDYGLDYLAKFYEDEYVIIYENPYYDPFYVYEDYYNADDVRQSLGETTDFLHFSKMLFDGVILEDNEYILNKKDFSYDDSSSKILDFNYQTSLNFENDEYVENVSFDKGYSGYIYVSGEEIHELNDIYIEEKGHRKGCAHVYDVYKCSFDSSVDKLIFKSDESIEQLNYIIVVEYDKDKQYVYRDGIDVIENGYLSYFSDPMNSMLLFDDTGKERACIYDFCSLYDFSLSYTLIEFEMSQYLKFDKNLNIMYDVDTFSDYIEKQEDKNAINKTITYDNSSINVKYERISNSENDQVVVLPITYSEEWVCSNKDYTLVRVNGGFLGVVVNNNIKTVDVTIKFRPGGVIIGVIGSCIGFSIYGCYIIFIFYKKKKESNLDENI